MPKFKVYNGLSAYAFSCGYIQRVELLDYDVHIRIDLWHEGACYHVSVSDYARTGSSRLSWNSFESIQEARAHWAQMVRHYAGAKIKAIKKDKRYSVALEYHGEAEPSWIARWLGDEVIKAVDGSTGTFGCSSAEQAWARCYSHNWNRTDYENRASEKDRTRAPGV